MSNIFVVGVGRSGTSLLQSMFAAHPSIAYMPRTGNGHARRVLVEASWCYRFPARQTAHLRRKARDASDEAQAIAWKAQKRLCGRYRLLCQSGKNTKLVCVAVARELVGFIWDIARQEMPRVAPQTAR